MKKLAALALIAVMILSLAACGKSQESVEEACAVHGVDPDDFIVDLKEYLATL